MKHAHKTSEEFRQVLLLPMRHQPGTPIFLLGVRQEVCRRYQESVNRHVGRWGVLAPQQRDSRVVVGRCAWCWKVQVVVVAPGLLLLVNVKFVLLRGHEGRRGSEGKSVRAGDKMSNVFVRSDNEKKTPGNVLSTVVSVLAIGEIKYGQRQH